MASFNLIRNSRVLFTTNVNSAGIIQTTGFTAANTQELNVLDGFTFTQGTNADTVTIAEAGTAPSRGQRSFNTSLNPVDFSFSTYMKPTLQDTVRAEESHLWNALLGTVALTDTGNALTFTTFTAATIVAATSTTSATLTLTGTIMAVANLVVGEFVQLKGAIGLGANELNAAYKVVSISATDIVLQFLQPPLTVSGNVFAKFPSTTGLISFQKASWIAYPAIVADTGGSVGINKVNGLSYTEISPFKSNANQLLAFGMIIVVDNVTYAIDNCALDQVSLDFGLDSIAMAAWTGKGTALRQLSTTLTFTIPTVQPGFNVQTVTTTLGSATVTFGAAVSYPAGTVLRQGGDIIGVLSGAVAASTTGTLTANASKAIAAGTTGLAGQVYLYTPTTFTGEFSGSMAAKFATSNYITNKLSTVTLVAGMSGSAGTSYAIPITGGSLQISNNISYVTPANLGVVNSPIGYYTGTRAITGSINAYLRTGASSTSSLISTLLATASAAVETKYQMGIQVGGLNNPVRVELLANGTSIQIPTIDAQAVLSTVINFTVEGFDGVTSANAAFDLEAVNDLRIRYFSN